MLSKFSYITMEPHPRPHTKLLFISFFSLIIFSSAYKIGMATNPTNVSMSQNNPPNFQPKPSSGQQSAPSANTTSASIPTPPSTSYHRSDSKSDSMSQTTYHSHPSNTNPPPISSESRCKTDSTGHPTKTNPPPVSNGYPSKTNTPPPVSTAYPSKPNAPPVSTSHPKTSPSLVSTGHPSNANPPSISRGSPSKRNPPLVSTDDSSNIDSPAVSTDDSSNTDSPTVSTEDPPNTDSPIVSTEEASNTDSPRVSPDKPSKKIPSLLPPGISTITNNLPVSTPLLPAIDPALNKICTSTDYPELCISTILPHLTGKADVLNALDVAVHVSSEFTTSCIQVAHELANSPETPPDMASIFSECKDSFDDALYNFKNAMEALQASDFGTMNAMLSAVITDVADCQDEHAEKRSPVYDQSEMVSKMASNCLAIVSLVNPS